MKPRQECQQQGVQSKCPIERGLCFIEIDYLLCLDRIKVMTGLRII